MESEKTEPAGKSHVEFTEWKVEQRRDGGFVCNKYSTVTENGVESPASAVRTVDVPYPTVGGRDIALVAAFAERFGYQTASLGDECIVRLWRTAADATRAALIDADKKA